MYKPGYEHFILTNILVIRFFYYNLRTTRACIYTSEHRKHAILNIFATTCYSSSQLLAHTHTYIYISLQNIYYAFFMLSIILRVGQVQQHVVWFIKILIRKIPDENFRMKTGLLQQTSEYINLQKKVKCSLATQDAI